MCYTVCAKQETKFLCSCVSFYLHIQLMKSNNLLSLSPSPSLPSCLPLSLSVSFPFPLKNSFFIQVVLSHGQHQHLIKPKDKHGPRSTAELISSPGSISQLPSICPNTNLLFFTGKTKRTSKQCCQINVTWAL